MLTLGHAFGYGEGLDVLRGIGGIDGGVNTESGEYGAGELAGTLVTAVAMLGNPYSTSGSAVQVTRWSGTGTLSAGQFVMVGPASTRNWVMAGGFQLNSSKVITTTVPAGSLRWPSGIEKFKGFLGQRIFSP
jgi:hypothetical protein